MSKKIWIIIISIVLIVLSVLGYLWYQATRVSTQLLYGAPLYRPNR